MATATDLAATTAAAEARLRLPGLPLRPPSRWEGDGLRRMIKPYIGTPLNALVTLACLALLWLAAKALWGYFVTRAVTAGGAQACKGAAGACWPFYEAKLRFMLFGVYPYEEHWRALLAMAVFFAAAAITMIPRFWGRGLFWLWAAATLAIAVLIAGGVPGLRPVPTSQWSGLPLSFLLSVVGLALGFPLGVVLALARASQLPAIRVLAIIFIEMIRGVPLISILFMASVMLPLFMPGGVTVDKLLRAQVAIVIFAAAYIAETVRGGLQAIPRGQHEAAGAMGLHYWQSMRLVILPQALKIVIPPLVTIFIGFFQDTTLVTIIGLLDFLSTVRTAMQDPTWLGLAVVEGYAFAALVFLIFSYGMGAYSRFLERRLRLGHD